jgi:DNA-binding NarL/FixJ family response regulator
MKNVIGRAVVADNRTLIADGLTMLLQSAANLHVSYTVTDLTELPAVLTKSSPDILILSIDDALDSADSRGDRSGPDADEIVIDLRRAGFEVPVLCLTEDDEPVRIARYLQAGIAGLLTTAASPEQLARAVRDVLAGRAGLAPAQVAEVIGRLTGTGPQRRRPAALEATGLTRRESEVLVRLTAGASTDDIAASLRISKHTVRTHVQNLLSKLGVHSKLEASAYAVRHGLVKPGV